MKTEVRADRNNLILSSTTTWNRGILMRGQRTKSTFCLKQNSTSSKNGGLFWRKFAIFQRFANIQCYVLTLGRNLHLMVIWCYCSKRYAENWSFAHFSNFHADFKYSSCFILWKHWLRFSRHFLKKTYHQVNAERSMSTYSGQELY